MKLALVTDAWLPQTNGVVRTLAMTTGLLQQSGHTVEVVEPRSFRTIPCPTYPEIRLAWRPYARIARQLTDLDPDSVHIATEGPLGLAARRWCRRHERAFTTSTAGRLASARSPTAPTSPRTRPWSCSRRGSASRSYGCPAARGWRPGPTPSFAGAGRSCTTG